MVRIILAGAACVLLVPLAGCNRMSDQEMRASFREHQVQSCVSGGQASPMAGRFDWSHLCGCAIDRYMAGRTTSDLQNAEPHDPALRAATQQCAMEQVGAAMGMTGRPGGAGAEENSATNMAQ